MPLIARFDIRTLLACQLLVALVFSLVFLAMKLAYRKLNGVGSLALAFLVATPGVLLVASRGEVPYFASVVLANALLLSSFLLMYRCVLRFQENRYGQRSRDSPKLWTAASIVLFTILFLAWFSMVHDSILPRIIVVSLASGALSLLTAIELHRQASGRLSLRLFALFMAIRACSCLWRIVLTLIHGAPSDFMQHDTVQALFVIQGILTFSLMGVFFLIMVIGELTRAIEHLASHDPLTGTLNRHGIEAILAAELNRSRRNGRPLSAVLIDVDKFKSINDAGGHAAGDAALRTVAQGIASSLRSYDLLGRFGGDEFLLILPETSATDALEVASRIRTLLAISVQSHAPALQPTLSIGIAETFVGDTAETLLARADAALGDAQHAGRNCIRRRYRSRINPASSSAPALDVLGAASFESGEAPARA
jgi:diguanylate cyclase (GGDEF)-like protein